MQLYMSATSPYSRIVAASLVEKGVQDRVERVLVDPWASGPEILDRAPLSRVPALVTDQGTVLTESLLIASYLERIFPEPALLPAPTLEQALHKLGLAHGLLDAAVYIVATTRYGSAREDDPLRARRLTAIRRALPQLSTAVASCGPRPDLGDLAATIALAYLDFRLPDLGWRAAQPELERWFERMAERPSLVETRPPV